MKAHADTLILNAHLVNEGRVVPSDLLIKAGRIEQLGADLQHCPADRVVDASHLHLLPGMIDDQVHFREPGLTRKGTIATESAAAVAGGITSYMEMPNVDPPTLNRAALAHKKATAARSSWANYAFYLGASCHNIDEIKAVDPRHTCGVKVFMGASTGNLLVEDPVALEAIFRESPILIATHCEEGKVIARNLARLDAQYGPDLDSRHHPQVRDAAACYASSSYAVDLARRHGSQLHVLHLTTARELDLFTALPLSNKHITAEVCIHHLMYCDQDYARLGNQIKCNPAIKGAADRQALREALVEGRLDIIGTDHAPHLWEEKQRPYREAPAGLPLVQHAVPSLLDLVSRGVFSLRQMVEKIAHAPAERFNVLERGYLREGYFADLTLVDLHAGTCVGDDPLLYQCGWSPQQGDRLTGSVVSTFVNGSRVYHRGRLQAQVVGNWAMPLVFDR